MTALAVQQPDPAAVLCKATLRAADLLGLTQKDLGEVLHIDRTSVARLIKRGQINPTSAQGEFALLLVRLYRSLFALVGDNREQLHHWMHADNLHLAGSPASRIRSVQGLVETVSYLDALRGRN